METYGRFTVIGSGEPNARGRQTLQCRCDCGNIKDVEATALRVGAIKSCGCLKHTKGRGLIDLTGKRFGRLTVIRRGADYMASDRTLVMWECVCDCGTTKLVRSKTLRDGSSRSCGCFARENTSRVNSTHRMSHQLEYRIWTGMKQRCYNPKLRHFEKYGGRGVTVCDRWRNSFEAFYADMGPCPPGHSIDRKDNNGHYEPGNCRWAPPEIQANNKLNNRFVTAFNERMTVAQAAERFQLKPWTLYRRLDDGFTVEDVIAGRKQRHGGKTYTLGDVTKTRKEWAREYGIDLNTLAIRIKRGWGFRKALTTPTAVTAHAE